MNIWRKPSEVFQGIPRPSPPKAPLRRAFRAGKARRAGNAAEERGPAVLSHLTLDNDIDLKEKEINGYYS